MTKENVVEECAHETNHKNLNIFAFIYEKYIFPAQ